MADNTVAEDEGEYAVKQEGNVVTTNLGNSYYQFGDSYLPLSAGQNGSYNFNTNQMYKEAGLTPEQIYMAQSPYNAGVYQNASAPTTKENWLAQGGNSYMYDMLYGAAGKPGNESYNQALPGIREIAGDPNYNPTWGQASYMDSLGQAPLTTDQGRAYQMIQALQTLPVTGSSNYTPTDLLMRGGVLGVAEDKQHQGMGYVNTPYWGSLLSPSSQQILAQNPSLNMLGDQAMVDAGIPVEDIAQAKEGYYNQDVQWNNKSFGDKAMPVIARVGSSIIGGMMGAGALGPILGAGAQALGAGGAAGTVGGGGAAAAGSGLAGAIGSGAGAGFGSALPGAVETGSRTGDWGSAAQQVGVGTGVGAVTGGLMEATGAGGLISDAGDYFAGSGGSPSTMSPDEFAAQLERTSAQTGMSPRQVMMMMENLTPAQQDAFLSNLLSEAAIAGGATPREYFQGKNTTGGMDYEMDYGIRNDRTGDIWSYEDVVPDNAYEIDYGTPEQRAYGNPQAYDPNLSGQAMKLASGLLPTLLDKAPPRESQFIQDRRANWEVPQVSRQVPVGAAMNIPGTDGMTSNPMNTQQYGAVRPVMENYTQDIVSMVQANPELLNDPAVYNLIQGQLENRGYNPRRYQGLDVEGNVGGLEDLLL